MATLRELLEAGNLGSEKTASAVANSSDMDGMDKLAMSLGLFGDLDTEKTAEFPPKKEDDDEGKDDKEEDEEEGEKKASGSLHGMFFPNSILGGAEKTATDKLAAEEEHLGAMAYDQFAKAFDGFISKLASEIVEENPHGDSQPSNRLPDNKAGGSTAIDTAPKVTNMLPASNDTGTVGHYEQKTAAFRKHMLLSLLED